MDLTIKDNELTVKFGEVGNTGRTFVKNLLIDNLNSGR